METARFVIVAMDGDARWGDLGTVLEGLSGVAHASLDSPSHTVSVEFDPDFVTVERMQATIEGTGYPVERVSEVDGENPGA